MGGICCGPERIDLDGEVDLFHFVLLRNVGKGAFGKVRMVQHKQSRKLYALKYIDKARCAKMKAVPNIIQERRLLEEVDHPFVVNLRYAFQDDENCFFVLDLMLGGDLRFHLERLKFLPEDTVRLYVAEISSALAFLHRKNIVHRDIKPDNILLDSRGHAHVTDFNVAVHHPQDKLLTSVAGSRAYIAPEVFAKKGYSYAVDWWSLGVTAFELAFGRRPFRGRRIGEVTRAICRGHLKFPQDVESKFSADGIGVLKRQRLGSGIRGELEDVKRQPWFRPIDWGKLDAKEIEPSLVPDANKPNFDVSHELEELLLEDRPLKVKRRKPNRDISSLSPELRQMEEQKLDARHTTHSMKRS
ncbi:kinase-like domain-containing protein [Gautieria morchelliformis]|nr:kinase-like domain-containing protein [Gautieria morchelliformis]